MLYLSFIRRNLLRKKVRTLMLVAVVALAFMLFTILGAVRQGIDGSIAIAGADRLVTVSAATGNRGMPSHYGEVIANTEGVASVAMATHLGAFYREPSNDFRVAGINPEGFLSTYPELLVPPDQLKAFLAERRGALVGKTLAQRMNWKVGDNIPLQSMANLNVDGNNIWNVQIEAIYDTAAGGASTSAMAVHYDFLNESRVLQKDSINYVVSRVSDPARLNEIAAAIDARLAGSSPPTRTSEERADAVNEVKQIGNIGAIMMQVSAAVFFSMLLVTVGVTIQSVRERATEISVMRVFGFHRGRIVAQITGESIIITLLGGAIGVAIAAVMVDAVRPDLAHYLESFRLPGATVAAALALSIVFGVIAAVPPAIFVSRLKIIDGLRSE